MAIVSFNMLRDLKFTRFTIDVLLQRIAQLVPPHNRGRAECERFVGDSRAAVATCDRLHDEISDRVHGIQPPDASALMSLRARLQELHRKIAAEITRFDLFEHGAERGNLATGRMPKAALTPGPGPARPHPLTPARARGSNRDVSKSDRFGRPIRTTASPSPTTAVPGGAV